MLMLLRMWRSLGNPVASDDTLATEKARKAGNHHS